ncbi:MAG: hypothetical protein IPO62_17730 [Saprospiraceae bacterium]|nr:hypothetical protein [Saprospiraceae bacterium]
MSLICTTVTTWVTQTVLDPVETWVSSQLQQCKNRPWPLNWLCWFVTILVKVIIWVTRYITVPILQTTCTVVTWIIGSIMLPFAAAIDALCLSCNALNWVNLWWITPTVITFVSKHESPNRPGYFDYTFTCNCKKGKKDIFVTALNDDEAKDLAIEECKKLCV